VEAPVEEERAGGVDLDTGRMGGVDIDAGRGVEVHAEE
jgi:hypothetical protein